LFKNVVCSFVYDYRHAKNLELHRQGSICIYKSFQSLVELAELTWFIALLYIVNC